MRDVEAFAHEHQIAELTPLLQRGALVARDPTAFESMAEITEEEKIHLRREKTHKWSHPWPLYFTVITCSIGAAVQGWDQTGSNGANLSFPQEFGIGDGHDPSLPNYDRDNWLVGLVNAAPYLSSALLGCWLSDPINHYLGRRGTIFVSAIFVLVTPIG